MPSAVDRIIAKVSALLPEDWVGNAGKRFRKTIDEIGGSQDLTSIAAEGAKRLAVGAVSRDHAQAVKNYADEEKARIESELLRRTLDARARQEEAKADQEEIRTKMMRCEEVLGRLKLVDELQKLNALTVVDASGNIQIIKAPTHYDWEEHRARVFNAEEVALTLPEAKADHE